MWNAKRLGMLAMAATLLWCGLALAAPEIGWWWNPNESDRGFFIESHDGIFFLGAFLYDQDGHARWLTSGKGNTDPYNYSGRLVEVDRGQTMFGPYVVPTPEVDVGPITVTFSDDTHGTIVWPGGTVPIVREVWADGVPVFHPFTGWWWNSDQSGTGYAVEQQNDTIFIVGFLYEDDGRPVWYYFTGNATTPTTFTGPVLQFANGQTLTGVYKPPTDPIPVAIMDVAFTGLDEATFTFRDLGTVPAAGPFAKAGRIRIINVKPQFPKCLPNRTSFPARYDGKFTQTAILHDTTNLFLDVQETFTIVGNPVFTPVGGDELAPPSPYKDACGRPVAMQRYWATGGDITVKYDYSSSVKFGSGPACTQSNPGQLFVIPTDLDPATLGTSVQLLLDITADSQYHLTIAVPQGNLQITAKGSCTTPDGMTIPLDPEQKDVVIDLGTHKGPDVYGFHDKDQRTVGEQVSNYTWDFAVRQ